MEAEVLPPGYKFAARRDRPTSSHGGVAIITRDNIDASEIPLTTQAEMVAASIPSKSTKPIIVSSIYRPTDNNKEYTVHLCDTIQQLHSSYRDHIFWIGGDSNLPDINWKTDNIEGHQYPISISQDFIDLFRDIGCQQVIDFPTRQSNTLDLFANNRTSLVSKCLGLPGLSDHDVILIDTTITAQKRRPVRRLIHIWSKADIDAVTADLEQYSQTLRERETSLPINTLWNEFKSVCTSTIHKNIPSKYTSTRYSQPWCNRNIKRLSRRKRRAHRKARSTNRQADWDRYHQLQRETKETCRSTHNNYINNMISDDNTNKKFYSFIKSKRTDNSGISPLRDDGTLHSAPSEKAEILNRQFSSVFTRENLHSVPHMGESPYHTAPDITVTEKGVLKLLNGLNPHKASGPDEISTRFLKTTATAKAPILTVIFQSSIDQGKVPDDWKSANVTPLFKKGDKAKASNYRPVSLTSVCCKIVQHIIHSQVIRHLETNNMLADEQHGFRKRRSCESQLINTVEDLTRGLNARQQIDAILLDFSKAFDKVPHERLAMKLHYYGARGHTLHWIKSFLSDRQQRVVVDGVSSKPAPVTSGVPKGNRIRAVIIPGLH